MLSSVSKRNFLFLPTTLIAGLALVTSSQSRALEKNGVQVPAYLVNAVNPEVMTETIKLLDAKVEPEVVIAYIKQSPTGWHPTATDIITLKDHGASPEMLRVLLEHQGSGPRTVVQQQAPQQPPATAPMTPPPSYSEAPPADQGGAYPYTQAVYPSYSYYGGYPYYSSYYPYYYPYYPYYSSFYWGWPYYSYYRYPYYHGYYHGYYGHGWNGHGNWNGGHWGGSGLHVSTGTRAAWAPATSHAMGTFGGHSGAAMHVSGGGGFHGGGGGGHGGGGHR